MVNLTTIIWGFFQYIIIIFSSRSIGIGGGFSVVKTFYHKVAYIYLNYRLQNSWFV